MSPKAKTISHLKWVEKVAIVGS